MSSAELYLTKHGMKANDAKYVAANVTGGRLKLLDLARSQVMEQKTPISGTYIRKYLTQ